MRRFLIPFLVLTFVAQSGHSEEIRSSLQNDLARTHGFYIGQKLSLERIQREHPALANSAARAQLAFDLVFKLAVESIEMELQKALGSGWPTYKSRLDQQIKASAGNSPLQPTQAEAFIREVSNRAKGQLESPILATLLTQHPDFQNNPAKEFLSGFTDTYRTNSHPKARGVDFQIQYPKSWLAKEGVRPNVIQLITNENGRGFESIILMVRELPLPANYNITATELDELFSEQSMKDMVPEGSTFISARPITLDRQKGGMLYYDSASQRVDVNLNTRSVQYMTIYKSKMIFVQCMTTSTSNDPVALRERFRKFEPLFKLVANSFVIQSQY